MTPPTQGWCRWRSWHYRPSGYGQASEVQTIHRIVEATKQAFGLRDHITDPRHVTLPVQSLLEQAPCKTGHSIDDTGPRPGAKAKDRAIPSGWA
jgi:gamma-glutamyltranspeptidase/glutathione hydrolase